MSSRSRAADNLAYHLSAELGIAVSLAWDNPSGRPGHGAWCVRWADGPTITAMRTDAEHFVRYCRPLRIEMLRFSRSTTLQAWAAAMLALAHRGELPDLPASAVGLAEAELIDTDTAEWPHLWTHAGQLVEQANQNLYKIVALVHASVTQPCHETDPAAAPRTCQHCAVPLAPSGTGRPARYCGSACRQAAHRADRNVTKRSHETTCTTCGRAFTPNSVGRPARHCSPTCRTRAWRHSHERPR